MTTRIWLDNNTTWVVDDCRVQVGDVVKTDDGVWRVLRVEHQLNPPTGLRKTAVEVMGESIRAAEDDRRDREDRDQAHTPGLRAFALVDRRDGRALLALPAPGPAVDGRTPHEGGV